MNASARLKPVQNFAERKEQDAAQAFVKSQQQVQQENSKLEQLRQYYLEYQAQFHQNAAAGMQVKRMLEFRAFLAKLENVIKEQERNLSRAQQNSQQAKNQWQQKQGRSKAIGKVVENHQVREEYQREKKLQAEQDDRSQHRKSVH